MSFDLVQAKAILETSKAAREFHQMSLRHEEWENSKNLFLINFKKFDLDEALSSLGFDTTTMNKREEEGCFYLVGKEVEISGITWRFAMTLHKMGTYIDLHLTRPGFTDTLTNGVTHLNLQKLRIVCAELAVRTEELCERRQTEWASVVPHTVEYADECLKRVERTGWISEPQREATLANLAERRSVLVISEEKRQNELKAARDASVAESEARNAEYRKNVSFLNFVIDRIQTNNWTDFELWKISYTTKNIAAIVREVHAADEEEESLHIVDLLLDFWSANRNPNTDGLFDSIAFSPYTVRPISVEGEIVSKELIRFTSLMSKGIRQGVARYRSWTLPGAGISKSYGTPYFVDTPKLPSEEDLVAWKNEWEATQVQG